MHRQKESERERETDRQRKREREREREDERERQTARERMRCFSVYSLEPAALQPSQLVFLPPAPLPHPPPFPD